MPVVQPVVLKDGVLQLADDADVVASPTVAVDVLGLTLPVGSVGKLLYVSGPSTTSLTDAAALATCLVVGVNTGVPNAVRKSGNATVEFTTAGGAPANGALVWAAVASDDGGTAAGKATGTIPLLNGVVVAPIGNVLDNANYALSKTCVVSISIGVPIALVAAVGVLKPAVPGTSVPVAGLVLAEELDPASIPSDGAAGTASLRTLSNTATTACAGNDARLSNSRAPTGAAGGDLGGTYPNPTVTSGTNHSHTAAQVSDASANGRSLVTATDYAVMRGLLGVASNGYMGAVCVVDQTLGSDLTGTRSGLPFATITAALAAAAAGDSVWIMPGTYNEAITIPTGVAVRGIDMRSVTVQRLLVTGDTTLITMGESSHLTNVTLRLTSAGHHTLVGVAWPGTTTQTALLENSEIHVDNSTALVGGTSTVIGCHSTGTGTDQGASIRAVLVRVSSVGGGTKRGLLVAGTATLHVHDFEAHVTSAGGAGTYIGAETSNAGAVLRLHFGAAGGATADISRTLGTLDLGSVNLVNANANGLGFTAILSAGQILMVYADDGPTPSGTRYMRPGTAAVSATEQFLRVPGKTVVRSISVRAAVGPGDARTDTWTVRINGVDTPVSVSLTAPATSAVANTTSAGSAVAFDMSIKQVCSSGSTTSDVVVVVGLY